MGAARGAKVGEYKDKVKGVAIRATRDVCLLCQAEKDVRSRS